jgi:hypothetical protein
MANKHALILISLFYKCLTLNVFESRREAASEPMMKRKQRRSNVARAVLLHRRDPRRPTLRPTRNAVHLGCPLPAAMKSISLGDARPLPQ